MVQLVRKVRGPSPHKFSFGPPASPPVPHSSELPCERVRYLSPQLKYMIFYIFTCKIRCSSPYKPMCRRFYFFGIHFNERKRKPFFENCSSVESGQNTPNTVTRMFATERNTANSIFSVSLDTASFYYGYFLTEILL